MYGCMYGWMDVHFHQYLKYIRGRYGLTDARCPNTDFPFSALAYLVKIIKVDLTQPVPRRVGSVDLPSSDSNLQTAVAIGSYVYFTEGSGPIQVGR